MIGFTTILVRINTAIQIAIVDQQYARAQALFLTFNNAYYPTLKKQQRLISTSTNQFILGVMDNSIGNDDSLVKPKATVQMISRNPLIRGSDESNQEPDFRSLVRIRNTVTLCTQTLFVGGGVGSSPILPLASNFLTAVGPSALSEQAVFNNFCGSPMKYEQ